MNAVKRLVEFEWKGDKESIRTEFKKILKNAGKCLDSFDDDHEKSLKEIKDLMKELEKPWKIKIYVENMADVQQNDTLETNLKI